MFGSFTLAWLQLEVVAPVFCWLPAGLVTMRRSVLRSWRWTVAAAASLALLFVSTHLLFADIAAVTICLYGGLLALGGAVARRRSAAARPLVPPARAVTSAVLGIGLAAFVLVPTASALSGISRQSLTFAEISKGMLLSFSDLRYAVWPAPLPITATEMNFEVAFAGTLTALCALVGIVLRRKGSGLGRGLVLGSVLVAVGGPVSWLAFTLIPGMNIFRPYSRLLFLFDLGLAVLGAVGLDAIMRKISGPVPVPVPTSASTPDAVGTVAAVGLGRRSHPGRWWAARGVGVVVVALTALQLGHYGRQINPPFLPSTPALSFPATPLVRALQAGGGGVAGWPDRVLPANDTAGTWQPPMLDSDDPLVFGIASANGYDSSVPTRTVDLWRVVGGEDPGEVIATKLTSAFQPTYDAPLVRFDLLPRVGVDQIAVTPPVMAATSLVSRIEALGWKTTYTGADGSVLTWTGPPTGPVVVFDARHVSDDATALAAFTGPSFDYRRQVILDSAGPPAHAPGHARVLSATEGVNSAVVRVRSSAPGYLVVPDMWDPGWTASVNGAPVPVQRGDFNEQVVRVPAGTAVVRMRYSPVGLAKGVALSVVALLVCIAILLAPLVTAMRRRPRPPRHARPSGAAAPPPPRRVERPLHAPVAVADGPDGAG
jgi:hypothetical protein